VDGWLSSELRAELEASGARIRPEVPFVLGLEGVVVRGKLDLLAEGPDGPLVVDYKTDALRGAEPAELAERYRTQRDLYALAIHGAHRNGGVAVVRAAYCFLEAPERASVEIYDASRIAAARERLARLVAGIRAGDFERTDHPHPALCYGCPAAARLCGKPAWKPQWASSSRGH
jgi:PD-(D/E)XK nuclease superfamily protein